MNQIKIGKFIAECRKKNNLTQMQLAEKLNITDRAISKWENGKGMPDSSIMLDLCNELKISVNELLCGELIEMNNYNEVAEKTLLEMAQKEEIQNKKLMMYENVIGFSSTISFLILIFVTSFLVENNIAKIVLFILAFVLLIIGVSFALKIEIRALELYAYNLEYMLDGEKSSDDERQKKIAMLKYTYEQVLSDQAEQVNTKRNNTNNLTAYGQKMINDSNIINMIPKNKDIRAV